MKIDSSTLTMGAASKSVEVYTKSESLHAWDDRVGKNAAVSQTVTAAPEQGVGQTEKDDDLSAMLELSEDGRNQLKNRSDGASGTYKMRSATLRDLLSDIENTRLDLLQRMIEALTGKKLNFRFLSDISLSSANGGASEGMSGVPQQGWGINYSKSEVYTKEQSVAYAAKGVVNTADGKQISVDFTLNMSSSFYYQNDVRVQAGDALLKDPLVVNFAASSAQLTSTKFSFDIDADGTSDQISMLGGGSGFLALDQNDNGVVDDGNELFGTQSGDGFGDLATYDKDNNGWIDENDDVYDKLRIWVRDESGRSELFALGEKGIGAICLNSAATKFDLDDDMARTNGVIQRTGIYLRENGTAGSIQHVDLAV